MSIRGKFEVSGFTIVRNAIQLDYPLRAAILSVLPLCDEFIINCGKSSDETLKLCREIQSEAPDKIRIFESEWNLDKQTAGLQLKQQTDLALSRCQGRWCFYIQSDEVIHEADHGSIRQQMAKADKDESVDGLVFDYLHFYGSYAYTIRGRNWYRREVRLFKNERGIEAFRDAQGFRKNGRRLTALPAHAQVFHYGYVRTPNSLQVKSQEMSRLWGEKPPEDPGAFELHRHFGLKKFRDTHPQWMRSRIALGGIAFDPKSCRRKWDRNELKNLVTLAWESIFRFRIGEFRNYDFR